jgi:hypothetical protein
MMGLKNFGEGFYVTLFFMILVAAILCVAMITDAPIATSIVAAVITVLGMIAAFWFPTRGQTSAGICADALEPPAEEA